jgi:hypothetical protein
MTSRRDFLLGSAAVIALGATTVIVEPTAASACAAVHKAMAEAYTTLRRDTHFALNSVLTAARDIYCPYCGEPVVRHV